MLNVVIWAMLSIHVEKWKLDSGGRIGRMGSLRRAAVAGSWYPADRVELAAEVEGHIGRAGVAAAPGAVLALVAPHAGLTYSGPVAAYAYGAVRRADYAAAVLVGPSHFVSFRGVSVWPDGEWETPFGAVPVDMALAGAIRSHSDEIVEVPAAHGREHSLEMQMPFLAHLLPGVPIVPLVMGHQTRRTAFATGEAIARAVADRAAAEPRAVLLVASSDLSHYESASTAAALDAVVIDHVGSLDAERLMGALEREPGHACGGGPIVTVLHAARRLGATKARVLRYADSGDVSGDKSAVVGYMAAAIW
jgi:AmmeMemoRadiSam system protein B